MLPLRRHADKGILPVNDQQAYWEAKILGCEACTYGDGPRSSRSLVGRTFPISFPERALSLRTILHRIYLKVANCPGSYLYSRPEMDRILEAAGASGWWYYVDADKVRYLTNLPQ